MTKDLNKNISQIQYNLLNLLIAPLFMVSLGGFAQIAGYHLAEVDLMHPKDASLTAILDSISNAKDVSSGTAFGVLFCQIAGYMGFVLMHTDGNDEIIAYQHDRAKSFFGRYELHGVIRRNNIYFYVFSNDISKSVMKQLVSKSKERVIVSDVSSTETSDEGSIFVYKENKAFVKRGNRFLPYTRTCQKSE